MRVVNGMAASPAVVGNQQHAVKNKSHHPFNPPVGVEGVMSAFVSQDPATHGNGAGDHAIENPKWYS